MIKTTRIRVDGIKPAYYIEDKFLKTVLEILNLYDLTIKDEKKKV
jgi:hypothetical protein